MLSATTQILDAPLTDLAERIAALSSFKARFAVHQEMQALALKAVFCSAYMIEYDAMPHDDCVKHAQRAMRDARRALGFAYPEMGIPQI